jgi:hypothetical protein
MSDFPNTEETLLNQKLRQARCDCLVLADVLDSLAEADQQDNPVGKMDRLYGVAHLLTLVARHVESHVLL